MTSQPAWTEQLVRPTGGQDHLGVGSVVTDRILPSLAPGINVLTDHPRYWAYYAFLVDQYWQDPNSKMTRGDLLHYIKRKEAIFSAAGHNCPHNHRSSQDPIGSQKMRPLVRENPATYAADFPFVKSPGGGYLLYYASVMQTMGIIQAADKQLGLPVDAVTPDRGKEVAEAFRDAIAGTRYWKKYWNADTVPRDVVIEYAASGCLCQLPNNAPDRPLVADAFLHGYGSADEIAEPAARRATLQMMLELAHQTRKTPIEQDDFRRLILYGATCNDTGKIVARFTAAEDLVSVMRRWRLSQLREMFNFALNGMWALITIWGQNEGGDYSPMPLARVLELADSATYSGVAGIGRVTGATTLSTFIDRIQAASNTTGSLDGSWDLNAPLTEDGLYQSIWNWELTDKQALGACFALYTLCLARLWNPAIPSDVGLSDWTPAVEGRTQRIGLSLALAQLRHDAESGKSVSESLRRVLRSQVVSQHERVATSKLRTGDTFRFRTEMGNVRFFRHGDQTLVRRNDTRFNALSATCAELNWSGFFDEANHDVTPEGDVIRQTGDLQAASR